MLQDRGGRIARHRGRDRCRYVVGGDAELRRAQWIDSERDGWSTDHDAVQRVFDPVDFLDRRLDLVGFFLQRRSVFAEQLYFDRLRITLQVADHVGHDAHKLDVQRRLPFGNLFAQLCDYFLSASFVIRL